MAKSESKSRPMPLLALMLSWLAPGAGHIYLGRYARGTVIFITIAATFWGGIAMGGVMTVDYFNERWWFMAQMITGVHGLVSWHRQNQVYAQMYEQLGPQAMSPPHQDNWLTRKGYVLAHPTDVIARAYTGVAGLLNLMCIFDAVMLSLMGVWGEPRRPEPTRPAAPPAEGD